MNKIQTMKKLLILAMLVVANMTIVAQQQTLYHPDANAEKDIETILIKAKSEHKFVLIQAGGNWCKWCIEFDRISKADHGIDSVIKAGFIVYHLNFSKENENKKTFAKYEYPQRFGFPVFIILNSNGQRIHTQNSEYLEDGKNSYNTNKVQSFLEFWGPNAVDPKKYGDQ
jgi:thioredoxin-related protein